MNSSAPDSSLRHQRLWLLATLLLIGAFFFSTYRTGHTWGDDFAMYLLHAGNLAEGRPYEATGYVYNPAEPHLGPPVYPPLFPLMLAPVYMLFGLNLTAFKVLITTTFLLYLAALYAILKPYLPAPWRLAAVVLMGLQPYFWDFKDAILSDIPGLLFAACAIWLAQTSYGSKQTIGRAVLLGLAIVVASGVRNTAVVLLPGIFVYEVLYWRRVSRFTLIAAVIAVAGLLVWRQYSPESAYASLFRLEPGWIVANTINYAKILRTFWLNGTSNALSYAVFGIGYLVAGWGLWTQRRNLGFLEIYALLHLALVISYSVPGAYRYLLPVLPLYLAYLLAGLRDGTRFLPPAMRTGALVAAVGAVLLTYAGLYSKQNWTTIREGVGDPEFISMANFIRQNVEPGEIITFRKPRVLALTSGHPSATYPNEATAQQLSEFLSSFHVQYVLAAKLTHEDFVPDQAVLRPFLDSAGPAAELVHTEGPYSLYRMKR